MTTHDVSQKVAETANRVRLIQISLADDGDDERREEISFEIEQALSEVIPAQRRVFLQQLMERFPIMGGGAEGPSATAAAPAEGVDQASLNDPHFLVRRLAEIGPSLSESQKQDLTAELHAAGLTAAAAASGAWSSDAEQELLQQLKLKDGQGIDPDRALALLGALAEMASSVDQFAGTAWHVLSGKAGSPARSQLRDKLGRFLTGDEDVSLEQTRKDVERLRQLAAALLAAVGRVAGQFAKSHVKRFSASTIEDWVRMEGVGFLKSFEAKCWQKFVELAADLNEDAIEREIMELMASSAEELMDS